MTSLCLAKITHKEQLLMEIIAKKYPYNNYKYNERTVCSLKEIEKRKIVPEITWAPRGNHVGPTRKSRGPHGEITWAPPGNHVGPTGKSRGPHPEITWAPPGNHVCPTRKSRGYVASLKVRIIRKHPTHIFNI